MEKLDGVDSVVRSVIESFLERARKGKEKYGTDLDRQDLSVLDWIQHAQEEHMDAILYLEKLKRGTQAFLAPLDPCTPCLTASQAFLAPLDPCTPCLTVSQAFLAPLDPCTPASFSPCPACLPCPSCPASLPPASCPACKVYPPNPNPTSKDVEQ